MARPQKTQPEELLPDPDYGEEELLPSPGGGADNAANEINLKVQHVQEQLLDLKRQQEEVERQKRELEELSRKQREFDEGRREIVEKLTRGLVLLERQEFEVKRELEQIRVVRDSFAEHLQQTENLTPAEWSRRARRKTSPRTCRRNTRRRRRNRSAPWCGRALPTRCRSCLCWSPSWWFTSCCVADLSRAHSAPQPFFSMPWSRSEPDPLKERRRQLAAQERELAKRMARLTHELKHGAPPTKNAAVEPPVWRMEEEGRATIPPEMSATRRPLARQRRRDKVIFFLCSAVLLVIVGLVFWLWKTHVAGAGG
jgi:hypothetical protein